MAAPINTNVASLNSQRALSSSNESLASSLKRLSSGLRINSAKDDAAGLAISERMSSQINGLNQATRNANDGISMAQTAEGGLASIGDSLQRMRELSVQASNASNSASDRAALQAEVDQLVEQINTVATQTSFNGIKLLDGSFNSQTFQVGANKGETIEISSIASAKANSLGVGTTSSYSTSIDGAVVTGTAIAQGGITVNGYNIGPSKSDGVSSAQADGSAIAVAAAFNAVSGQTGVTAVANATVTAADAITAGTAITGTAGTDAIYVNGVNIGAVEASTDDAGQGNNLAAAINAVSNQTGVTASFNSTDGLVLTAADGRNIEITDDGTNDLGLTEATTRGKVSLNSTSSAGITLGGTTGLTAAGLNAFEGENPAEAKFGAGVSTIDITTAGGAQNAIDIIDSALQNINSSRASLGAYQNRFSSAVSNLQTSAENITASRSRIRDADFAAETANLSRAQVLQQAGTAMLAQANGLPQNVLSLLR